MVFSNAITSTSFIPIGVNYLTLLGNLRVKCHPLEKSGVYQITEAKYIGQTKRCTLTRFKEHIRHIKYNHPDLSSVASHIFDHFHETNNEYRIMLF
jgi:hypothetical protein